MGEIYEPDSTGFNAYKIDVFNVGDTVYDNRNSHNIGKVVSIFRDLKTRKTYVWVKWQDGEVELCLHEWLRKDPKLTRWSPPQGTEHEQPLYNEDSPAKTKRPVKNLRQLNLKVPDIKDLSLDVVKISKLSGKTEIDVEKYLESCKIVKFQNGKKIYMKGDNYIVVDDDKVEFYRGDNYVDGIDFFKQSSSNKITVYNQFDGTYILKWGNDEFLLERGEVEEFLKENGYGNINLDKEVIEVE